MSYQREVLKEAAVGVGIAKSAENLSVIQTPGCAAAIWQRPITCRWSSMTRHRRSRTWYEAKTCSTQRQFTFFFKVNRPNLHFDTLKPGI